MRVCIDPGHGGGDPGAVGRDPFLLKEKEVNLEISLTLEAELRQHDYFVTMTRRRDRSLSLPARADFVNRVGADLFVSLHANAAGDPSVEGIEVFHFPGSVRGGNAAHQVLYRLMDAFPDHRCRGVKEANFAVLRETSMPAILVETEFLTSPTQLCFLRRLENRQLIASAIAEGIRGLRWSENCPP